MQSDDAKRIDLSVAIANRETHDGWTTAVASEQSRASESANSAKLTRLQKAAALLVIAMLVVLAGSAAWLHPQTAACDDRQVCPTTAKADSEKHAAVSSPKVLDANGNRSRLIRASKTGVIQSSKTGAEARVDARYGAQFQAYIDDLEENYQARVYFMGGYRRGHCATAHQHPCGKALDVCQLSRGVVSSRCHLPAPALLAKIAAAHGLFEGGRWCDSDYGHAQVETTASSCARRRARMARQAQDQMTAAWGETDPQR